MYDPRNTWNQIKKEIRVLPVFLRGNFIRPHFDGKKSIFIMISSFSRGGAQRVASVLASELSSRYHVTAVISREVEDAYPLDEKVEVLMLPNDGISAEQFRRDSFCL